MGVPQESGDAAEGANDNEVRHRSRDSKKARGVQVAEDGTALSGADAIAQYVLNKYRNMDKAEKFFDKLHATVGTESPLGIVFTEEEITEGWLRCQSAFEEQPAEDDEEDVEENFEEKHAKKK